MTHANDDRDPRSPGFRGTPLETLLADVDGRTDAEAVEVARRLASPDELAAAETYRTLRSVLAGDEAAEPSPALRSSLVEIFDPSVLPAADAPGWLESLGRAVASIVHDGRTPLAGVRGAVDVDRIERSYAHGEFEIDLQAVPGEVDGAWVLRGQIDAADPAVAAAVELAACAAGTRIARTTARTDEHGEFALELPSGRWELCLRLAGTVIVLGDLDLR